MEILDGSDLNWLSLVEKMIQLSTIEVDAGYLTSKIHPNSQLTYAALATIHQYGSEKHNIPERPFISDGAVLSQQGIVQALPASYLNFLKSGNKESFKPIAKISGESIARAIAEQKFTKLSDVTLRDRKSRNNPSSLILIDEGYLINNIETDITQK